MSDEGRWRQTGEMHGSHPPAHRPAPAPRLPTPCRPTEEMSSRGDPASLLVGLFFAIPSGAGVALSATQVRSPLLARCGQATRLSCLALAAGLQLEIGSSPYATTCLPKRQREMR